MLDLLILLIVINIIIVFVAALLFVNTIEYIGFKFKLSSSFVGAILSPLFTSFPEMVIFLVAILVVREEKIGIGTILGQPFMASSLSYGLVGIAAIFGYYLKKRKDLIFYVDRSLVIPYVFVTSLLPLTLVPDLIGFNKLFGVILLFSYFYYFKLMYQKGSVEIETIEDANDIYAFKLIPNKMIATIIQLIFSVILLYIGSKELVYSVKELALTLGVSEMGLALIIVPAATAIPETSTAIIWGFRGKSTLSMASLVGEKVLYSTFYPSLGLFLTSWDLDHHAYMCVGATIVISLILLYYIIKQRVPVYALMFGFIFFVSYVILVFVFHC